MSDKVLGQFKQNVAEERISDGKKLKVGIIGTGWIAESHIECYMKMKDVEIVAGADLIPGKAESFFRRYGLEGVFSRGDSPIYQRKWIEIQNECMPSHALQLH